jgi:hypothetical protein
LTLPCFADLWPRQYGDARPLMTYGGGTSGELPGPMAEAIDRQWVAHNCHEFDEWVWREKVRPVPTAFGDSIHGCRATGLPSRLDDLGKKFFGTGKDAGNLIMQKLMRLEWDGSGWSNKNTTPGNVAAVARYCVADVVILERVWQEVADAPIGRILPTHRAINQRGIGFDAELARKLIDFGNRAKNESAREIERLTDNELTESDLRSTPKMKNWLLSHGVRVDNMRRSTVDQLLSNPDKFLEAVSEALSEDET